MAADKFLLLCAFWLFAHFALGSDKDKVLDDGQLKSQFEAAFQGE